jgi:transcriptional antiterminator
MSKTLDERQQFIELRAKGYSFQKLSDELGISKPTLIEWSKNSDISRDIQNQRTLLVDDLQERYAITRRHRIALFGEFLDKAKDELNKRDMSDIPTDRLITMVIKLSDTLKADETELELMGSVELQPIVLGEQTTWKI